MTKILSFIALGLFAVSMVGCGGAAAPTNVDSRQTGTEAAKAGKELKEKVVAGGEDTEISGEIKAAGVVPPKGPDGPRKATPAGTPAQQ